jgi:GntR family transcriptional regulator/MocR family aminotransferase
MIGPLSGKGPLYKQVYSAIREAILSGKMPSGSMLPPTRELVQVLHISRTTILIAYAELVAEGYAIAQVGSGTFVSDHLPDRSLQSSPAIPCVPNIQIRSGQRLSIALKTSETPKAVIPSNRPVICPSKSLFCDFHYNPLPTGDFPLRVWNKLVAKHGSVALKQDSGAEGSLSLRMAIAAHLMASRGIVCDSDQIIIVNGTQQGLDLTARVLLDPHDTVAIEEAHYLGARDVFQAVGARLLPVPLDQDGIRVMDLAGRPKKERITLVYVTPSHQMPTGAILSVERRTQLLDWAIQNEAYILEDDYDGEYRYDGLPLQSLRGMSQSERVIYFGSFSRSISSAIRIGFIVAPPQLIGKLRKAKWRTDRHSPLMTQEVLAEFINLGHFERHLRRMRGRNYRRRTALFEAFAEHFGDSVEIQGGDAGVHVLARFGGAGSIDISDLITRVAAVGIRVYPVAPFFLRAFHRFELLFGYAALPERLIREGIRQFHSAYQEFKEQPLSRGDCSLTRVTA